MLAKPGEGERRGEARKGPLARTINAKRWSDPTNGTRSEWANRSQFVTIGTCTSLSFETATSCVPSPLSLPLTIHHFMRASKERERKIRRRRQKKGKVFASRRRLSRGSSLSSLFASNTAECSGIISPFVSTSSYFSAGRAVQDKRGAKRERGPGPSSTNRRNRRDYGEGTRGKNNSSVHFSEQVFGKRGQERK